MQETPGLHGSCAAWHGSGVLLLGQPESGKSDLLLRLIDRGFILVADDRVVVEAGHARPPEALAGLIELRGLGLLRMPYLAPVPLRLVLELRSAIAEPVRLPEPRTHPTLDVPLLQIWPFAASACLRIEIALDCLAGRRRLDVGAIGGMSETQP